MFTLFTFGYWGWGNAVPQLVQAADAIEARRGFAPPLFVDLRWHRSVRAKGFNGDALKSVVGEERHVWMKRLGNRKIVGRQGDEIEIAEPAAVETLLDLVLEHAADNRRLIAFCACPLPCRDGRAICHRRTVAELTLVAAQARGVPLTIIEWPGAPLVASTSPTVLETSDAMLRQVERGRATVPISDAAALERFAAFPWGRVVELRSPGRALPIVSGPAIYSRGWALPVSRATGEPPSAFTSLAVAERIGADFRRDHGFDPLTVG